MAKRKTKTEMRAEIDVYTLSWRGIELEIGFERNWLGSPPSEYHPSHLEIRTVNPMRQQLPITETGYLSHFVAAGDIDRQGGPVAYVVAWLDEAAKDKRWKSSVEAARQLSLF